MRLNEREQAIADRIREEAPGDILRLEPGVNGFLVVQALPDASQPTLSRVTLEEYPDGSESLHWELLGSVDPSGLESDDSQPS